MTVTTLKSDQATVISERVFKRWDYLIFAVLSGAILCSIAYFPVYWFSLRDWMYFPIPFTIMTLGFLLNLAMHQMRWLTLPLMRCPRLIKPRSGWKVGFATTFVPGAESIEMLEETVRALVGLDYPHETWVLDEGDDGQVKELCLRLGAYHFSRKHLPQYQAATGTFESRSKHGNYNAWLYEIGFDRYEIVAAFDPDHVPKPDFLPNVLGYFDDPTIGYVQAAQVYYNQKASFIARGAAEDSYAFYGPIQMTSYALGYPIVVGCHNTHRVAALKQVGGFAPHAADDLLITIFYRVRGWKGVYVPKDLAEGLTPVDWNGYLNQQRRWARSVLDIKFRIYPKVAGKLPFWERLVSFVHGLYYLQGICTGLQVALLAFMLVTGITPAVFSLLTMPRLAVLLIVLQVGDFYRQRFYIDPRHEAGLHWRSGLLTLAKWPFVLLALFDALKQNRGYTITKKVSAASNRSILLVPYALIMSFIASAWVMGMILGHIKNPMLHISTAIIMLSSLGLILSERLKFPDPYNPNLRAKEATPQFPKATAKSQG
jgi:cellulose synthase (UDP-forming)